MSFKEKEVVTVLIFIRHRGKFLFPLGLSIYSSNKFLISTYYVSDMDTHTHTHTLTHTFMLSSQLLWKAQQSHMAECGHIIPLKERVKTCKQ